MIDKKQYRVLNGKAECLSSSVVLNIFCVHASRLCAYIYYNSSYEYQEYPMCFNTNNLCTLGINTNFIVSHQYGFVINRNFYLYSALIHSFLIIVCSSLIIISC